MYYNIMFARFFHLFILTILFQLKVSGQNLHTISGIVRDDKGETLPYVSVLIAGSTRGTQTDQSGKFVISNVAAGNYQLIVSFIGYDRITRSITVKGQGNYQEYILKPSPVSLNGVVVSYDPDRDKHLALFKKFFIGETANAKQCLLLNPEAIHTRFDKNTQLLSVSADSLLVIDNRALGYRVKYLLTGFELDYKKAVFKFSGIPLFEELNGNNKKKEQWDRLRQKAYNGSVMHFFRSAYNNSVGSNGFMLYSTSQQGNVKDKQLKKLEPSQVFAATDSQFVSARIDSSLYVVYTKENTPWDFTATGDRIRIPLEAIYKNAQVSKITMLCDSLIIDKNGNYIPDKNHSLLQGIDFQGQWAWEKVADLLPFDYQDKNVIMDPDALAQSAAEPVMEKVAGRLGKWLDDYQPEKIYLQTDKPYYAAGDNIWFKIYITAGNRHQLSALSASVNVELLDEQGSVKQWIKLPVLSGMARGDLALPDTLHQGKYRLRAYTNWMRNAGPDYYFDRQLAIGNENARTPETKKAGRNKAAIMFFPESGNLVNGLRSVVAFKAVASDGLGIDVKGRVTDGQNNTVCTFGTSRLGMGQFSFIPEKGKAYKALVTYPDGSQNTAALPAALNSGYVLHVNNTDTANIYVRVTASAGLSAGQVYLYAQTGGETRYIVKNKPGTMPFNAVIPKSRFPTGIVQFTLFSAAGEPLNERIAFIDHPDELLNLTVSPGKTATATAPQGKVKLNLDVRNAADEPVSGSFSVAVIDESKVKGDGENETTILSQLLLTADLRGYVEQPAWYFDKSDDSTRNNLDVLMLTQGYRRFEWKPLLTGTIPPVIYPAERQAGISGTIKTKNGKPVPDARVTLVSGDGSFFSPEVSTDQQGRFRFSNLFKDSTQLVLQATSAKNGRNVDILIDDTYDRNPRVAGPYPEVLGPGEKENLSAYLASSKELYRQERKYGLNNRAIVLKEVDIRSVRKPKVERSGNLNGPGNANLVITAEELEKRGSIDLMHTIEKFAVTQRVLSASIILDGVKVHKDVIASIPIAMVASVEYLKTFNYTTIYGPTGRNGVLVITTKGVGDTKTSPSKEAAPGILAFSPKGYYLAREFYSPQYDDPKTNKTLANLRNTVYWQPDLVTDQTGHASFEYYNAGSPGTYRVIIEGIGADGNLGRKVYRYKVE